MLALCHSSGRVTENHNVILKKYLSSSSTQSCENTRTGLWPKSWGDSESHLRHYIQSFHPTASLLRRGPSPAKRWYTLGSPMVLERGALQMTWTLSCQYIRDALHCPVSSPL